MKNLFNYIFLFAFMAVAFQIQAQQFSGEILTEHVDENGTAYELKWVTDNNKMLMHYMINGDYLTVIMDPSTMQNISWHNKDTEHYFEASQDMTGINAKQSDWVAKNTGETKMINGKECTKVVGQSGNKSLEVWVDQSVKVDFYKYAAFASQFDVLVALYKTKTMGVPVKAEVKDAVGNVINSWNLDQVTPRAVSAGELSAPAGYELYTQEEQ